MAKQAGKKQIPASIKSSVSEAQQGGDLEALQGMVDKLLREKSALENKLIEAKRNSIEADPEESMAYLREQNERLLAAVGALVKNGAGAAGNQKPNASAHGDASLPPIRHAKDRVAAPPFVFTDARKEQIVAFLEPFKDSGMEYAFDEFGLTLRKKYWARTTDPETGDRMRVERWKSEWIHASSMDRRIVAVARLISIPG